jgi:hypothetical protein
MGHEYKKGTVFGIDQWEGEEERQNWEWRDSNVLNCAHTHAQTHMYVYIYTHTHIYECIYILIHIKIA